ncbi:MAG: hypothetical protein KF893_02585 [Caldilineaceae bacterium]|nr:hypothetical protein [Caldilineaceae bacterium]
MKFPAIPDYATRYMLISLLIAVLLYGAACTPANVFTAASSPQEGEDATLSVESTAPSEVAEASNTSIRAEC